MKCEKGDLAKIIHSIRPDNIGKHVVVEEYIGHLQQGELFVFRSITCKAIITDHYWWVANDNGLTNMLGDSPKVYIPDTWLDPIRPTKKKETAKKELDIVM